MTTPRAGHSATLLTDGRVLIAGGHDCAVPVAMYYVDPECTPLASAEIYDPQTRTFRATGSLTTVRGANTATLLADGQVLVIAELAEIYEPKTGTFQRLPDGEPIWEGSTATVLRDGRVLVAGGSIYIPGDDTHPDSLHALARAEIFDPKTGTFTPTGPMRTARMHHRATLLADGRVLIVGGDGDFVYADESFTPLASAEIYDPKTGTFTPTGKLRTARMLPSTTLLADGRVLVAGGTQGWDAIASAEIFDPRTRTFASTGKLTTPRFDQAATLLADGRVLITSGYDIYFDNPYRVPFASAEIYNPKTGTFGRTGSMQAVRSDYTATLLPEGRVLIAGGDGSLDPEDAGPNILASAELYSPKTGTFSSMGATAPEQP